MDHPDRSVLREGSKGPLPEGACDSQPLAQESMDQAVSMPHRVRISPMHGPPCQRARHPPLPLLMEHPPGNSLCESTQHTALHTPFTRLRGPWPVATAVAGPGCITSPKRQLQYNW